MQLMTKQLEARFAAIGRQDGKDDPIVVAKFFNPTGAGTWYATEISEFRMHNPITGARKVTNDFKVKEEAAGLGYLIEDVIFFGYVSIFGDGCDEWGDFSLVELKEYRGAFGMGIERDLHCGEKPISQFNIKSL